MCVTMAARVSSHFPNLDKNEAAYAEFIKEKIDKAGGQIKFQHITGHLSQLDLSVREAIGASPLDLRKFLKKHNVFFTVDSDGFVACQKSSVAPVEDTVRNARVDNSENSNDTASLFPVTLKEVPGIVIKVLPKFGFIAIKNPVKTTVYFTPACVVDKTFQIKDEDKGVFLTDFPDMLPGKKVLVNAKKANSNLDAKYRATRVWTPSNVKNEVLVPEGFMPKVPKDGMYDPVSIEGSGKVQKVFEQFGFITNDNSSENIFFHKSTVSNVQNIMNLAKVFSPGDLVEFKAIRSTKKVKNVKWEASKVWIKKQGKTNLFKTDSTKIGLSETESQKGNQETKSSNFRQILKNEPGKVYPHTDGVVIKFGKHDAELADADSCPFYVHSSKVQDVCWEFSDADKVNFDAMRIKSAPGWKALLAWVGVRPNVVLPVHMSDFTEFSDEDSASVNEKIIADKKPKVFQNSEFSKQSRRNYSSDRSKTFRPSSAVTPVSNSRSNSKSRASVDRDFDLTSSDRSKMFRPTSAVTQVSYSRSNSKSRASVDRDYDLYSEDTMSTVSGDSKANTFTRTRRRQRRPRYNASNPIRKGSSYSSLTDAGLDSEDSYNNQDTGEFHNSDSCRGDSGSNILAPATLKASSSFESLDLNNCLKPNSEYQNWGDTPYPGEENEMSPPAEEISNPKQDIRLNPVKNSSETKSSSQIKSLKEMFLADDDDDEEFSDAVQDNENVAVEVKSQKPVEDSSNVSNITLENTDSINAFTDIMNLTDSEKESVTETKSSPSVKFFTDLEGKILQVHCKYAVIEHPKLTDSVSVLWSDLYHDGVPVADKFDDMKEVIKRDQTIKFNCIQIIDDTGTCWKKVTIAWKGQKPKVTDMTPQKYISENYLQVSIPESEFDLGNRGNSSQTNIPLNIPAPQAKVPPPPKKFLTLANLPCEDEDSDQDYDSSSDESDAVPEVDVENSQIENDAASISSVEGEDDLAEAVGQMITSVSDSKVDIRALSSNIINLVRSKMVTPKSIDLLKSSGNSEVIEYSTESEKHPPESPSPKLKNEMRNSETQTIITGDVIAQSIFTL